MVMHMGDHIRLVVNAACVEKDMDYLRGHFENRLPLTFTQLPRALVAVQGPVAETVLSELIVGLADLAFYAAGATFSFVRAMRFRFHVLAIQVRMDLRSVCQMLLHVHLSTQYVRPVKRNWLVLLPETV